MAKIKLEYDLGIFVIGKADDMFRMHYAIGSKLPGPLFSHGQVTLHAGLTVKDEFTLGSDGASNIDLAAFQYYNTKKSFLKGLKDIDCDINDYKNDVEWVRIAKETDQCKFTYALMNAIYSKTFSTKLWISTLWSLNGC